LNIPLTLNKTDVNKIMDLLYWRAHKMNDLKAAELWYKINEQVNGRTK
jgi:hypothetical protein